VTDQPGTEPGADGKMSELVTLPLEEAMLLAGRLESEGIRAVVPGQDQLPVWGAPGTMPGLQQTDFVVLVETDKLEQARQIVDEIRGS
jgi:hypothetical protein